MQLLALIPLLLLLLQPVSVLATTPNNDHLEKPKPPVSTLATTPDDHMEKLKLPVSALATIPDNDHVEKLNPPVCGLATSPNNDHMERLKLGGVRHEDTGPARMTIFDAFVEGDNSGGGNGGGNDASIQKGGTSKPKKRAVRAEWYTFQFRGMMYHIRMNSSLGETYRNLATKAEQREFAMEHGEAEPVWGRRVRAVR